MFRTFSTQIGFQVIYKQLRVLLQWFTEHWFIKCSHFHWMHLIC